MIARFNSPDYDAVFPPSKGGGPVVTEYDLAVCLAVAPDPNNPYVLTTVPRSAVSPDSTAGAYKLTLPTFSPSIANKDVVLFIREKNTSEGLLGAWGSPSPTFYGGLPTLGVCNVASVNPT